YQCFKVDDVIRIYRKSHANTEIARYSVAYRVVRSTPLFISIDDIKQNRFIDMLTERASVYRIYTYISASVDGVDSAVSACIYACVHGIDLVSVSLSDLQY